ncbi:MAG: Rab family GTPase [Candidatus Lokiarchaeia archaeon]|nr:Rab family GTPase [Candidatus Lokiarchaeia archaeon]
MVKSLTFGIIFSEFDDILGPTSKMSFPEIDEDFGIKIAMKSIDILSLDEITNSKSLAFLTFPKEKKKGIARIIEWKDETTRGRVGTGAITLIFEEVDDLIYYKYVEDLEEIFDEASEKIIELKLSKSNNNVLSKEIKEIHAKFLNKLEQLRDLELGIKDDSEEFPREKKVDSSDKFSFKVIVCGDPACGKTSAVLRFTDHAFIRTYISTLGVNITAKDMQVDDIKVTLIMWDIAGQMKFNFLRNQFYAGAQAVLLLFDVTRTSTFKNIINWYKDIINSLESDSSLIVVLCGNKIDLIEERRVLTEEAKSLANELNIDYVETSALTGENIDQTFRKIARELVDKIVIPLNL